MMDLRHRKIKIDEAEKVFELLKASAEWLQEREIDYWQSWQNPSSQYIEWILEGLKKEEFYFVENNEGVVGMYRLQNEDEIFWGKRTDLSGYVHSFTTKRELYGKGIGKHILKDIEKELCNKGISYLRLDCGSGIRGLCKYYEDYGFKAVGEIKLFDELLTLYEKKVEC